MGNLSRRDFLKLSGVTGAGLGASALLAACNNGGGASAGGSASAGDKVKIGISIWSSTDALGSLSVDICKKAAKVLGADTTVVDQGHVSEQVTASAETLAAAGCNGIIICNSADSEMTSVINTCNQNEMFVTQFYRIISETASPDVYDVAKKSKYYVGAVHEDEVLNGKTLMGLLLQKGGPNKTGARHICLEGWTVGDATFQLHTHPDMDALIVAGGGGDPLVGSIGQLKNMGKTGQISVVSTDFLPDLAEQLSTGGMFAESGGHFCDPLYAFILTYQACTGKLQVKDGEFGYEIKFPYVYVSSSEEYAEYEKYFVNDAPYNDDEIKALAEDDFSKLNSAAEALSIEDVKKRHA